MPQSLCVFANFSIDNNERFKRMKDSFYSFRNINPEQWIINIRGRLKSQAGKFLKKELGDKIKIFNLQSRQGWFCDTKIIISHINSDYVFIWVEDHILINNLINLKNSILEMKKFKVDQLWYSFLTNEIKDRFAILPSYKKGKYITVTKIDEDACYKIRNKLKSDFYNIAMISIMRRDYFVKVIHSPKPFLKRWPRYLPFDFEKKSTDKVFPIILHALPNKELFASIDDDHGQDGYSLISRGIYKSSISREALKKMEFFNPKSNTKRLKKYIPKKLISLVAKTVFFIRRVNFTLNIFKHR